MEEATTNPEEATAAPGRKKQVRSTAVMAAAFAIPVVMLYTGLSIASALAAAGSVTKSVSSWGQYDREALQHRIDKHDWYGQFLDNPVWDGPEAERVIAAQEAEDAARFAPVKADMDSSTERTLPGARWILHRSVEDMAPEPLSASAPLDTPTATSMPVLLTAELGSAACGSGDVDAFVSNLEQNPTPILSTPGGALETAWAQDAPVLVRAAASDICPQG